MKKRLFLAWFALSFPVLIQAVSAFCAEDIDTDVKLSVHSYLNGEGKVTGLRIYLTPGSAATGVKFRNNETSRTLYVNDTQLTRGTDFTWESNSTVGTTDDTDASWQTADEFRVDFSTPQETGQSFKIGTLTWKSDVNENGYKFNVAIGFVLGDQCCQLADANPPAVSAVAAAGISDTYMLLRVTASDTDGCGDAADVAACQVSVDGGAWADCAFSDGIAKVEGLTAGTAYSLQVRVTDLAGNASPVYDAGSFTTAILPLSEFCGTVFKGSGNGSPVLLSANTLWNASRTAVTGVYFTVAPYGSDTEAAFRGGGIGGTLTLDGAALASSDYVRKVSGSSCLLLFAEERPAGGVLGWTMTEWTCTSNTNSYWSSDKTFTLGYDCPSSDTESPSLTTVTAGKGGSGAFGLRLEGSSDIVAYRITIDGSHTTVMTADLSAGTDTITVSMPSGMTLDETGVEVTVEGFDAASNYSNAVTLTVQRNTEMPEVTAACGFSLGTSLVVEVKGTEGTGGCIVKYKAKAGTVVYEELKAVDGAIVLDGLSSDETYDIEVWAIDELGNQSAAASFVSCATHSGNAYCGTVMANSNNTYGSDINFFSRVVLSMAKTGTDELTVLIAPYPGTTEVAGADLYLRDSDGNNQGYMRVRPGADNATYTYPDLTTWNSASGTGTYKMTDCTVEWVNVTYPGSAGTYRALKMKGRYTGDVTRMYLRWYKESPYYTAANPEFKEATLYNTALPLDLTQLDCDNVNVTELDVEWGANGNPVELDTPVTLTANPLDETATSAAIACQRLIAGTTFSPEASGTLSFASIADVTLTDHTEGYDFVMGTNYKDRFYNATDGSFMSSGQAYSIVSDPSTLAADLSRRTDGVNRLVFNCRAAVYGSASDTLFSWRFRHLEAGSEYMVQFDYEDVTPECVRYNEGTYSLRDRILSVKLGTTELLQNIKIGASGTVTLVGTATGLVDRLLVRNAQSEDCTALAISNVRVYGCISPYVKTDMYENTACEGTQVTLTAVGLDTAAGVSWLVSDSENGAYTALGKQGEEIVVDATLSRKYYKATDGTSVSSASSVLGVVCCNSLTSTTLWSEDFGTVAPWTRDSSDYVVSSIKFKDLYRLSDYPVNPVDPTNTATTTLANGEEVWTWPSRVSDGNYAVASNSSYLNVAVPWIDGRTDHTGNPNGGFLLINMPGCQDDADGNKIPIQILSKDVEANFCVGAWYNFSMWASQLSAYGEVPGQFILKIYELNGESGSYTVGTQLGEIVTGKMPVYEMDEWMQYSLSVATLHDVKALRLEVWNVGPGGNESGNDVAIDDLSFTTCNPEVELYGDAGSMSVDGEFECGTHSSMRVVFAGDSTYYFGTDNDPYYTWQKSDDGKSWTTVAGPSVKLSSYSEKTQSVEGEYFRVVVSNSAAAAEAKIAGTDLPDCGIALFTNTSKVSCAGGCLNPVLESLTQDVDKICAGAGTQVSLTATVKAGSDYTSPSGQITSYGVDSYIWEYLPASGSGEWTAFSTETSTALSDTRNYSPTDSVKVRVRVTNTANCADTLGVKEIAVVPVPDAPIVADDTHSNPQMACVGDAAVTYWGAASEGCELQWYTASAGGTAESTAPSQSTAVAGTYSWYVSRKLTAAPGCESARAEAKVTVNALPSLTLQTDVATLTCKDAESEATLSSTMTAAETAGYDFLWFDNTTGASVTVTEPSATAQSYWARVTDKATGCVSATAYVQVAQDTVAPSLSIETPDGTLITSCTASYAINAVTVESGSYAWNNGETSASLSTRSAGDYKVTFTASGNGCVSEAAVTMTNAIEMPSITITPSAAERIITCATPQIEFSASGLYKGSSDGLEYTWPQSNVAAKAGSYTVRVTHTASSCTTDSVLVVGENVVKPSVAVTPAAATLTCATTSVTLTAESGTAGVSYRWNDGSANAAFTASAEGTYSVTVTDPANGCESDPASVTVSADYTEPSLSITSTSKTLTCAEPQAVLTATADNSSFVWDDDAATEGASLTVTRPGVYTVTATDLTTGCSASLESDPIDEDKTPLVIEVDPSATEVRIGGTLTVNLHVVSGEYNTLTWTRDGREFTPDDAEYMQVKPFSASSYSVTAEGDCNSDSAEVSVTVVWPTVFTPYDKNGVNDGFVQGMDPKVSMLIYDRFGNKMAETDDGWDGMIQTASGTRIATPGVYYFVATMPTDDGSSEQYRGTVEVYKR